VRQPGKFWKSLHNFEIIVIVNEYNTLFDKFSQIVSR